MLKDDIHSLFSPELMSELMSNKEFVDLLCETYEDEMLVVNDKCKISCKGVPVILRAILCNVKIQIDNCGAVDIETDKLYDSEEPYMKLVYNNYLDKIKPEILSIRMLIDDLIKNFIQLQNLDSLINSINEEAAVINSKLEEKSKSIGILHKLRSKNIRSAVRYIGYARYDILKLKKDLECCLYELEAAKQQRQTLDNTINRLRNDLIGSFNCIIN